MKIVLVLLALAFSLGYLVGQARFQRAMTVLILETNEHDGRYWVEIVGCGEFGPTYIQPEVYGPGAGHGFSCGDKWLRFGIYVTVL